MRSLYRRLLSFLVRRELRSITGNYPVSLNDLIDYHDFMAIEGMDNQRILRMSLSSSKYLRDLQELNAQKFC